MSKQARTVKAAPEKSHEQLVADLARLESRLAELELAHETQSAELKTLRENEECLRAVIDNSPNAISLKSADGHYIFINRVYEKISGKTNEAARGKTSHELFPKAFADSGVAQDRTVIETGEIVEQEEEVRFDDGEHTLLTVKFPVRDASGEIVAVGGISTDITTRKEAEQRVEHLAQHDRLTNLPNRALFLDRLRQGAAHARRHKDIMGLHLLDLDHFKDVNDTLGHHVGDELLKSVAGRLNASIRETDTVARLGGDEFAIVQTEVNDLRGTTDLAERVIDALSKPFVIEGSRIHTGATIGLAIFPDDATNTEELLQKADLALYAGKAKGRNTFQFFDEKMSANLQTRKVIEADQRDALSQGEGFDLHYQPLVTLDTGRIIGIEALVRWTHPERGAIKPRDFIPVAESTGLIRDLDTWAMRVATRQLAEWHAAGHRLRLALNVSAAQVLSNGYVALVKKTLKDTGLEPSAIEIEITEDMFLRTRDPAVGKSLRNLDKLGVNISVDDFGIGYGSLTYLRRFPISKVKIDASFVNGIGKDAGDEAIVRAVNGLGHSLEMRTLAEGIETEVQVAFLRNEGCDEGQGYFFGRPARPRRRDDGASRGKEIGIPRRPEFSGRLLDRFARSTPL